MNQSNKKIKLSGMALIIGISVIFGGCSSSKELTKAEETLQIEAKEKQKVEMAEKKILSDFQNKAYKIYSLEQMATLTPILSKEIVKLSQENAVKMILNFELSQRMALQNDAKYGAVSPAMADVLNGSDQIGIIDFAKVQLPNQTLQDELKQIQESFYAVYKDENGIYRLVDYNQLKQFKPYLSDEYGQYIDFMATENNTPSIKNKSLNISLEESWRRLAVLDQFFSDYPVPSDDLIRNNLGRYYQDIFKYLIYGNDLKVNFDPMTKKMNPEVMVFLTSCQFAPTSKLYLPFENFKAQLILDQGMMTPIVGTHIQELERLTEEMLNDLID